MAQNTYGLRYDEFGRTTEILLYSRGTMAMANNFINKGTAFTEQERRQLGRHHLQAGFPLGVLCNARREGLDGLRA